MIVLGIILIALILSTWLYGVYVSWKVSQGIHSSPIEAAPFVTRWARTIRLARRGWYGTSIQIHKALSWCSAHLTKAFVKVFPKSSSMFIKHDAMTGLTQGPSSYFLKSISVPQKQSPKRLPKTKKML